MKTEEQVQERKEQLIQMYKKIHKELEYSNFSKQEVYIRLGIIKAHLDELNYILGE